MPNANGLDLQDELRQRGSKLPIIFITGYGDIPMAVRAMKAGASDFLTKPFRGQDLLDAINSALARDRQRHEADAKLRAVKARVEALTPRQRTVFHMWADGLSAIEISDQLKVQFAEPFSSLGTRSGQSSGRKHSVIMMRIGVAVRDLPRANEGDLAQSRVIPSGTHAEETSRRNAATAVTA